MSDKKKPVMLLWVNDPSAFQAALEKVGVADRFDIQHVKPGGVATEEQMAGVEVLLSFGVPPGALKEMPRLKWLQSMTAGVDNWLARPDLKPDLPLTAARGTHRRQMPENILGALFHVTKHYHTIALNQAKSEWVQSSSVTLAGKTLGILGLGAIGAELARKAAALDMRVIGTRRTAGPVPHVEQVLGTEGTEEVLRQSDFVVVLLPVTPATE
ncbi:MAG: NAD(P)-dependent oxidoreductase, partial [Hyphomicrobiaceae bacterium]